MPTDKQIGRASALLGLSRKPQPPFVRSKCDLPLPKPVKSAMLASKATASGECGVKSGEKRGDVSNAVGCGSDGGKGQG